MGPATGNPENTKKDATAAVAWLDKQKEVDTKRGIGTTGYCMGGPLVMRTMAFQPDRVKAGGTLPWRRPRSRAPQPDQPAPARSPDEVQSRAHRRRPKRRQAGPDGEGKGESRLRRRQASRLRSRSIPPTTAGARPTARSSTRSRHDRAWARLLATFKVGLA